MIVTSTTRRDLPALHDLGLGARSFEFLGAAVLRYGFILSTRCQPRRAAADDGD
jgi:hypothetical protein